MTYSDDILALSPIAYWRLGESSGTVDEVAVFPRALSTDEMTALYEATGL